MEWLIGGALAIIALVGVGVSLGVYSSHRRSKIEHRKEAFHQLRRMWRLGCGIVSYDVAKKSMPPWLPTLVEAPDHTVEEMIEKLAKDFSIVP